MLESQLEAVFSEAVLNDFFFLIKLADIPCPDTALLIIRHEIGASRRNLFVVSRQVPIPARNGPDPSRSLKLVLRQYGSSTLFRLSLVAMWSGKDCSFVNLCGGETSSWTSCFFGLS